MPATEVDFPLYANIAERSSNHMFQKRGDTAQRIVMRKHGANQTRKKGKDLSQKKHRAERNFRICLQIVSVLLANGLLTEKEAVRVRKELIKICKSVIGILYDSKEWRDK